MTRAPPAFIIGWLYHGWQPFGLLQAAPKPLHSFGSGAMPLPELQSELRALALLRAAADSVGLRYADRSDEDAPSFPLKARLARSRVCGLWE